MPDIDVRRAHDLGREGARRAADRLAADLGHRFDLRSAWDGDVLRFERAGLSGSLAIEARALHLTVSLGLVLKAMKRSIEGAIFDELERLFPARAAAAPEMRATRTKREKGRPKKGD